jgi:exonuclease SbcD
MKILHTSDWHLGKRLDDFPRFEEQQAVMNEICEIADCENVDAVLVAGDLFDTFNPPTEAVDLLYKTLKKLTNNGKRPVIAIAGNHDSPDRIEAPDPLARECGIIFAGYPGTVVPAFELETGLKIFHSEEGFIEINLPGNPVPLRLLLTPYANALRFKTFLGEENSEEEMRNLLQQKWAQLAAKNCDEKGVNVLVSHLFVVDEGGEMPEEPDDEKPVLHVGGVQAVYTKNIPENIQFTALGHLHRMHSPGRNAWYCGSPLSYSFAEAGQKKYVLLAEIEPCNQAKVTPVELTSGKKLLRFRAEGVDAAMDWLQQNPDCLVELTLATDNFLTAAERKQLNAIHDGIVALIPEVKNTGLSETFSKKNIDPGKSMDALFREYFQFAKGQEPNDELMELFVELLAQEEEK